MEISIEINSYIFDSLSFSTMELFQLIPNIYHYYDNYTTNANDHTSLLKLVIFYNITYLGVYFKVNALVLLLV
jgi:hypothetical protein